VGRQAGEEEKSTYRSTKISAIGEQKVVGALILWLSVVRVWGKWTLTPLSEFPLVKLP
jgi:hypothetical protein